MFLSLLEPIMFIPFHLESEQDDSTRQEEEMTKSYKLHDER